LKSVVLTITAYDLDSVDIRDLIALTNTGMWKFQSGMVNGFLGKYPDFLKLTATGAGDLSNAKTALIAASQYFSDAQISLENETDDSQDNDLFVYENEGDEMEFTGFVNGLSELKDSLVENRPATSEYFRYAWDVAAENGDEIHLVLNEDVFGNGTRWREGSDFWGTVGGQQVSGQLVFWERDGANVTAILDYWGYKRIVAVGVLMGEDSKTLVGGCTYLEYNGLEFVEKSVSSFTADQAYFWADDLERVDLNALFGIAEKSQLVIREVLPEFDLFGEPMAGTFPEPFLNGLLPDLTTNDAVVAELELDPPYQVFDIPVATIVLDGEKSDWPANSLVAKDQDGLLLDGLEQARGIDVIQTFLAKDTQYLYVAMELAGTPVTTDSYNLNLNKHRDNHWQDVLNISVWYDSANQTWQISGFSRDAAGNYGSIDIPPNSHVATGDGFIEWRVPLDTLGDLTAFGGSWISFGTFSQEINQGDWLDANARLAPVYTVTGTVAVPDGYTGGNIYYYLWDQGWDPFANNAWKVLKKYGVSGTFTENDSPFTLTDVPYSSRDMYLYVFWDRDGNGIPSSGDYTGMSAPFSVQENMDLGTVELTDRISGRPLEVAVKHVSHGGRPSQTWFDIWIDSAYLQMPEDIDSITIIDPDGVRYQIWPDGGALWDPLFDMFWAWLPGAPILGEYTVVVTARDGSMGTNSDTQKTVFDIPVVDVNTVTIDTGSKTPVFSWNPVHVPGNDIYYRLQIEGVTVPFSFQSQRTRGMTSCTAPRLEPGQTYRYRIRATDHGDWIQMDNRSNTDWVDFTMDDTLVAHSSVPAIDMESWGAVKWSHEGISPGVDLWVKIVDHDGVANDGSSHHVYARPVDADGNFIGSDVIQLYGNDVRNVFEVYYSGWINNPDQLPEGTKGIQFSVEDPDGNRGSVIDMITEDSMVPPEDIGLACAVNGSTSPTFSWNPVQGANYYRIRIYDENRNTVLNWTIGNQTETTIPPGYLRPDTTYQYRLEARNNHMGFDIDENFAFPRRDASGNYPTFTTGTVSELPFVDISNDGVFTWNRDHLGSVTNFWVKVYDAQGVDNIHHVKVVHPDKTTETELYVEYMESGNCAVFSNESHDEAGPQSGTYTFIAVDKDGNQSVPVTEELTAIPMGYPDQASLSVNLQGDTGAQFAWDAVDGAAFYRVEIYDSHRNRIYKFPVTENHYSLAPGFLKQGEVYGFRVTTRREFLDQNVDNASTSPWSTYDLVTFKTDPADTGGTSHPEIDTGNFGAAVTCLTHPGTGQDIYWVQFSVQVSDADGVPENIKSVTVSGPGITESLPLGFVGGGDGKTAEYWARLVYGAYEDIPEGEYTFRVEDEDGNIATTTDLLKKTEVPPAVNITPVGGSIVSADRPVIAWDTPAGGPWFYRVKILQHWEKTIHDSGIISDNRYVVPGHVLQPGETYHYWVYIYDGDMETRDVDNLSLHGVFSSDLTRFDVSETLRRMGLSDVLQLLKILMGKTAAIPSFDVDVNDNNQLDLQDAIPVLQEAGGMR
jgi:hypothetical protein